MRKFSLLAIVLLPLLKAAAQTLTITNGVQTHAAITNTTVTMTGKCELRLTSTNNPISGCMINLNSADAWVLLPNIRPSVVSATYLSQFRVNGANAVLNTNVRLSEYAMGTMVIPHSPSITPLQVFSGPNFLGASTNLALYTYYTNTAGLALFYRNIGSFRLKRGYMATFAQNADGTGSSQVFIAQDGDLDVGFLAINLGQPVSFVRVFPWRWTAKKGWGGGSLIDNTLPLWWYDWGNSSVSTLDREYPPMKWGGGSGTSSIKNKQNSTHTFGYNEPDSSVQANMTTTAAIADWPTMMQWGLRVGAPAVSDSGVTGEGLDWLYNFMNQATNLGYRVDFIPIHWYKCGQSPNQMSNYLYSIYQRYKKPIWLTEWNNGASWCSSGLPGDYNANAIAISNFVNMLEAAPFVERYAIYQWFAGSTIELITNNILTPAGVVYLNAQSKVAYTQVLPTGGSRSIAQFHFENDTLDSSGYANHGFAVSNPNYANGQVGQAIMLDGTNSFIQLPPNTANSVSFSFAAWVYWNGGANWQRIFDFGDDQTHYLFLTPSSGSGTLRFAIRNGGSEQSFETTALPVSQWTHIAVTLTNGSAKIYTNGVLAASSSSITIAPSNFNPNLNYLGKSQFPADPLFQGSLDEVQMADYAFTAAQVAALLTNTPPQFVTNIIISSSATQSMAYSGSLVGAATDADPGDTLTYSKVSGPAWLNVAADGTLTGTPTPSDSGTNIFTVRVTDTAGASAFAGLTINTIAFNANGVWNVNADGVWSGTNNWSNNLIGNGAGFTADFSTLDITADRTVTLDVSRTIGTLKFGDTSGSQSWLLTSTDASVLTLDTGLGTSPPIVVNQNTAILSTSLAGFNGFTKSGAGTLTLSGTNTYSGTTIISAGTLNFNSSASQSLSGIISGNGALSQASGTLTLLANNTFTGGTTVNGGTLNLGIGGSSGAVRNILTLNPGATVNLTVGDALGYTAGVCVTTVNIVGGTLTNSSGGNEAYNTTFNLTGGKMSSSGGVYNLNGASAAINSLATNIVSTISAPLGLRASGLVISTAVGTVPGGVDLNISGVMGDLQGSGFNWTKSGAGTLQLSGANTNSGTATVNSGTLLVNGVIAGAVNLVGGTLGGNGIIKGPVTVQASGILSPGNSIGRLNISNSLALSGTCFMELSKTVQTNDNIRGVSTLAYGGSLWVTNLAGTLAVGDNFKLFGAAGYNGSFASLNLPPLNAGLGWQFTTTNGTLSVVAVAMSPANIIAVAMGNSLELSWPTQYTGWRLEVQTNALRAGLGAIWFDVPNSAFTNRVVIPIDPGNESVFYRLVAP